LKTYIYKVLEKEFGHTRLKKRKFTVDWLQNQLISLCFGDRREFEDSGGYATLTQSIAEIVKECRIEPIKSSKLTSKWPPIPTTYWLIENRSQASWDKTKMLFLREYLNLDYYDKHPELQTEGIWTRLERTYQFLKSASDRQMATREERSLELYDEEKWLSDPAGERFLRSCGLTLEDLKAKVYSEPFVFYCKELINVQSALIVENHSFFHSYKRLMQKGLDPYGLKPEMLIYGEGWKIESSIPFLMELGIEARQVKLYYVGDMDLTGWSIYVSLKKRYPELDLRLASPIYAHMVIECEVPYPYPLLNRVGDPYAGQTCKPEDLDQIYHEFTVDKELQQQVRYLAEEERRIPQEVLSFEVMERLDRHELGRLRRTQ